MKRYNKKKLNSEDLIARLKECQKLKKEYLDGWQRARADFLNYKKAETERISEILKYRVEELNSKILLILDNFNFAEKKLPKELENDEYIKGIFQIKKQFQDFFKNQGIEEIKTIGEKFDPNFHEVIEEVESKDKKPGIIVSEIKKGYILHGKIIRPAKVKIAK